MTWSTLRHSALEMGFDVAYRSRPAESGGYQPDCVSPPAEDGPWLCIGSYELTAGVWVHPLTDAARTLSPQAVVAAMASADQFVTPAPDPDAGYSSDFIAAAGPGRLAVEHPEWGRMPA